MPENIVYFDLETQKTANDVGGWDKKHLMKMSIGVTYSTATGEYRVYQESQVEELIQQLVKADLVVGYNTINFDYQVLMAYTVLDLPSMLHSLDLLVEIEKQIGARIKLESVAQATLGVGKTAEGLEAILWWRQGKIMEIAEYCCFDVKVTKLVHEYGVEHGEVLYDDRFGRPQRVPASWAKTPKVAAP